MTSTHACYKNPTMVRSDSEVDRGEHVVCNNTAQTKSAILVSSSRVNITENNVVTCLSVPKGVPKTPLDRRHSLTATNSAPSFVEPTMWYLVPCHHDGREVDSSTWSAKLPLLTHSDNDESTTKVSKSLSWMSCERMVKTVLGARCNMTRQGVPPLEKKPPVSDSCSFSTITSEGPICRICHEGDQVGKLVQPCRCCGTLSYAHQKCLEKWLQTKNGDVCELCQYQFHTRRKDRPFKEWLQTPSRPRDRRNIIMDIMCFCFLTPMVFTSAWLCLHGAHYYLTYFDNRDLEGMGLIILASVLLVIFLLWSAVSFRYHCSIWNVWRRENQLIHIVVADRTQLSSASDENNSSSNCSHKSNCSIALPEGKMDINGNFMWLPKVPPGAAFV